MANGHIDLRTSWGLELLSWWIYYNDLYLGGVLRRPVLRIATGTAQLGTWDRATRTIAIAEPHIAGDAWLAVMNTLRHEMAHQYADEVLGAESEPPHGPAFRRACEQLCIEPRACGTGAEISAEAAPAPPPRGIVEKIHKLLSLSSSPNEHEAQVAVNKARELLLRHNIDEGDLTGPRRFGVRWLGPMRARHHHWETLIASILNEFFFVNSIWTNSYDAPRRRRGTVLSIFGSAANLEMAAYVYGYLTALLDELWRAYKKRKGLRGNSERLRYFAGVMSGFRSKLREQDKTLRERYALVWKGDAALDAHVKRLYPNMRTTSTGGALRTPAYQDGEADGRAVTLRRPLGSSRGGFGGYLTARKAESGG